MSIMSLGFFIFTPTSVSLSPYRLYLLGSNKKTKVSRNAKTVVVFRFKIQTGCCKFPMYNVAPPSLCSNIQLLWAGSRYMTSHPKRAASLAQLCPQGFPASESSQMSGEGRRQTDRRTHAVPVLRSCLPSLKNLLSLLRHIIHGKCQ